MTRCTVTRSTSANLQPVVVLLVTGKRKNVKHPLSPHRTRSGHLQAKRLLESVTAAPSTSPGFPSPTPPPRVLGQLPDHRSRPWALGGESAHLDPSFCGGSLNTQPASRITGFSTTESRQRRTLLCEAALPRPCLLPQAVQGGLASLFWKRPPQHTHMARSVLLQVPYSEA